MSIEITVPRLGWSMEEGTFAGWLKQNGDAVSVGEPLFAVESDKVTMDVESLDAGILQIPPDAPEQGAIVRVGQCIGFLVGQPIQAAAGNIARPTPRARRIAAELSVDIAKLKGTGKGGRIREADVRGAAPAQQPPPPQPSLRHTIARRMEQSHQNTVPVTLTTKADATRLVALRQQASYNVLIARLAAQALEKHPALGGPHIGIAVDTPQGLLVPVLRDVAATGLADLSRRSQDLIAAARERRLRPEDLTGGTFSITNLGAFGIDAFTPVINYPEAAVLGIGAIRKEVVVRDNGDFGVRDQITLSLTFDHRVVDGAPAARFLQDLVRLIEAR